MPACNICLPQRTSFLPTALKPFSQDLSPSPHHLSCCLPSLRSQPLLVLSCPGCSCLCLLELPSKGGLIGTSLQGDRAGKEVLSAERGGRYGAGGKASGLAQWHVLTHCRRARRSGPEQSLPRPHQSMGAALPAESLPCPHTHLSCG